MQSGLKKAERAEELQRQNQRLRESVKERGDELVRAGQRIAELEAMLNAPSRGRRARSRLGLATAAPTTTTTKSSDE